MDAIISENLDLKALMAYLRISKPAIYRAMKDEKVKLPKPYRVSARRVVWKLSEIQKWQDERKVQSGGAA